MTSLRSPNCFLYLSQALGVTALVLGLSGGAAKAEPGTMAADAIAPTTTSLQAWQPGSDMVALNPDLESAPVQLSAAPLNLSASDAQTATLTSKVATAPVPGRALTSASALKADVSSNRPAIAQADPTDPTTTPDTTPSQTTPDTPDTTTSPLSDIEPGRATRSGSSYIGIGGNIGIGSGDTALGDGSFAILSKVGLTRRFSVRPTLLVEDDATLLLPVTVDFSPGEGPTDRIGFRAAPYLGIGPAISFGDDTDLDLLLTGGLDIPLGENFTVNAAVNATVTGNAAIGLLIGIGYNF